MGVVCSLWYLLVLQVSELDQDLGSRVLDIEELEDGGTIVGDGDILGPGCAMSKVGEDKQKRYRSITRVQMAAAQKEREAECNGDSAIEGSARGVCAERLTPTSSTIILSRPTGPSEVLTMFATETAACTEYSGERVSKRGPAIQISEPAALRLHTREARWQRHDLAPSADVPYLGGTRPCQVTSGRK